MIYRTILNHVILLFGVFIMLSPILLIFFSSSQSTSDLRTSGMQFEFGNHLVQNYDSVLNFESGQTQSLIHYHSFVLNDYQIRTAYH